MEDRGFRPSPATLGRRGWSRMGLKHQGSSWCPIHPIWTSSCWDWRVFTLRPTAQESGPKRNQMIGKMSGLSGRLCRANSPASIVHNKIRTEMSRRGNTMNFVFLRRKFPQKSLFVFFLKSLAVPVQAVLARKRLASPSGCGCYDWSEQGREREREQHVGRIGRRGRLSYRDS